MNLDARATYPVGRSYVLKLHRDAAASPTGLAGRIEHLASGLIQEFESGPELLALLATELECPQAPCEAGQS